MNNQDLKNLEASIAKHFAHELILVKILALVANTYPRSQEIVDICEKSLVSTELTGAPTEFIDTNRSNISFVFTRAKSELK
jgi:hypothetical protein